MMMSHILKLVNSSKKQESKYLENKTLLLSNKKIHS